MCVTHRCCCCCCSLTSDCENFVETRFSAPNSWCVCSWTNIISPSQTCQHEQQQQQLVIYLAHSRAATLFGARKVVGTAKPATNNKNSWTKESLALSRACVVSCGKSSASRHVHSAKHNVRPPSLFLGDMNKSSSIERWTRKGFSWTWVSCASRYANNHHRLFFFCR